jgi:hypothetical protein
MPFQLKAGDGLAPGEVTRRSPTASSRHDDGPDDGVRRAIRVGAARGGARHGSVHT